MRPDTTVTTFSDLKNDKHAHAAKVAAQLAKDAQPQDERVSGYFVQQRVQDALRHVGNDTLADLIQNCSRSSRCQSIWCAQCRETAVASSHALLCKRVAPLEEVYQALDGSTTIDRSDPAFNDYMNGELLHVSGYVGMFSLDSQAVSDGIDLDRKRWKKIKGRRRSVEFWVTGTYELEVVNIRYLMQRHNPESAKKKEQVSQLLAYSRQQGWIADGAEVGVLVHWHGVTNATQTMLRDALKDAYYLSGEKPYNVDGSGLYVQKLHADKAFDDNMDKIAGYPLKSATRYKHSFIGSDTGDELLTKDHLGALITLYQEVQGRSWRCLKIDHTVK
ncbi:hypothetical protein [Celeribacter ethanolicus]|uniref:hypothetical protein n=1 Tax=Celeribacter ethanolicus TaxID=1758178 RepID=UPI00082D3047|nr:hypothetical protein [Celeribacter ethanolicus]